IRDGHVTGVQTCALPISPRLRSALAVGVACDYGGGGHTPPGTNDRHARAHRPAWPTPRRQSSPHAHWKPLARPWLYPEDAAHGRSEERRVGKERRVGVVG